MAESTGNVNEKLTPGTNASNGHGQSSEAESANHVAGLWRDFKHTGSDEARNRLVEHFQPLVRAAAERVWAKLPREVDIADLRSAGTFGLMDAIKAFDTDRGVKFETYCAARVRGAILDQLRVLDWVPRLVRTKAHRLQAAVRSVEIRLGRPPNEEEVADELGLSMSELHDMVREASAAAMLSLNWHAHDDSDNRGGRDMTYFQDKRLGNAMGNLQRDDLRKLVLKGLSKTERLIILLYYYDELTMKEIGAILDLSESRISQMHASILLRLQLQLRERASEFLQE